MTLDIAAAQQRRLPLLPVAVAAYALGALALSPETYISMLGQYLRETLVLPVLLAVGLAIAALSLRPRAPLAFIRDLAERAGLRFLAIFAGFCIGLAAFTTYKLAIPSLVPFYADPWLADIDAALHFGNPGEHVHAILPGWLQRPLASLYGPVWFLQWFALMALVALLDDAPLRRRYLWGMALTICLLGTVSAIAFSSVGPVMYEPIYHVDRFADLMDMLSKSAAGDYMREASGYLLTNYRNGGHDLGTGISAMPSMHLAIVTLNALMLRSVSKLGSNIAWAYLVAILLGSVFLGWHYAIDGYYSILVVVLIWWALGRLLKPRDPAPSAPERAIP